MNAPRRIGRHGPEPIMDQVGQIIAYESGELDDQETAHLFQYLVDTGLAWSLQGHYGREAARRIEAGRVIVT